MAIINELPEAGGSGDSSINELILYNYITREDRYGYSYTNVTTANVLLMYAIYNSSTVNQTARFYALKDCTATIKSGTTSTPSTVVDTIPLTAGHRYQAFKQAASSSANTYFELADQTTSTQLVKKTNNNYYWSITFS